MSLDFQLLQRLCVILEHEYLLSESMHILKKNVSTHLCLVSINFHFNGRSHKEKRSSYAPQGGVRYDGVYRIEKCWRKPGIQVSILLKRKLNSI